jgi:hypothetical protein
MVYRDPHSGKYAFDDDFDRLCRCGHTLGVHVAGGLECGIVPKATDCNCTTFCPTGKRLEKVS